MELRGEREREREREMEMKGKENREKRLNEKRELHEKKKKYLCITSSYYRLPKMAVYYN